MDNRVPYSTEASGRTFALGKFYPSLEAAEKGVAETIARRETIAGRKLTARELRDGVTQRDDMDKAAKIAAANWQPTMPPAPAIDDNPFRRAEQQREPRNRKELMKKAERDWDARHEAAVVDPQSAKAAAAAESLWEKVAFDPNATTSQRTRVEQLKRQTQGDLKVFKSMSDELVAQLDAKHADEVRSAQTAYDHATQRLRFLKPEAFDAKRIELATWGDGEKYYGVLNAQGATIEKWKAGTEPAEIKQQYEEQTNG